MCCCESRPAGLPHATDAQRASHAARLLRAGLPQGDTPPWVPWTQAQHGQRRRSTGSVPCRRSGTSAGWSPQPAEPAGTRQSPRHACAPPTCGQTTTKWRAGREGLSLPRGWCGWDDTHLPPLPALHSHFSGLPPGPQLAGRPARHLPGTGTGAAQPSRQSVTHQPPTTTASISSCLM